MPPPPHTKPENVLKRAQELIGVQQSQAALSLLHEHVISKRTRNNPIASLEPVMLLFVELCVDLRKGKAAKDGLYSYKNTAQNTNVATIELVLRSFIERARKKVEEAQEKADEVHSTLETGTSTANVDDLEATETPESILLSTVSGEQSRDRTDRAIVTPWLKFLWETYRTVLDILKNNSKLEIMYQSTAHEAFTFCQKYTRKTEFRRLCELLRNHLQNAAKYQSQIHAINLSDPDTLQRHLDTRFQQLNVAAELELWQEAFRSVEDIHTLLNLSKRPAKNVMMANYFEKLTTIFLVSENYLFHSAAYIRLFNLLRSSIASVAAGTSPKKDNPPATEQDLSNCASFVVLSALSIPVISTSRSRGALVDVDEARKTKNQRLTNLIGMSTTPSRSSLFKEIQSKGLLKRAKPEIRELYTILEVDFHPLSICKKISPILARIGADAEMGKYVLPLQQVILTRLFQQLSQVYESVDLSFVLGLAQFPEPFQVTSGMVEKFIMNGCKKGDLAIRIDHASGVITFDSDVFSASKAMHPTSAAGSAESETGSVQRLQSTPAEIVRSQLTRLAKSLFVTCQYVDPSINEEQRRARALALQRAEAGAEQEHKEVLERRAIIERKKQDASNAAAKRARDEAQRKQVRAYEQQQEEKARQIQEQTERDRKRQEQEQQKIKRDETMKQIKDLQNVKGVDVNTLNPDELDPAGVRAILLAALERDKNELTERLRITGKRIDHLERAFRREEIKHLSADYAEQKKIDYAEYERSSAETLADAERKHKDDVALKRRLSRLLNPYEQFRDKITADRAAEFERRHKTAAKELEEKKRQRVREFRERRAAERAAEEQRQREEEEERERVEREEREKAAREEERKAKLAEERARREEERQKLDEVAAKQRQREEEAEARRSARTGGASIPTRTASESVPAPTGPPRIAASKGGWREREAAKREAAASGNGQPSPAPEAEAVAPPPPPPSQSQSQRSGYVPPHLRGRGGASDAPPAGETMSEGWRSSRAQAAGRDDSSARAPRGPSGANGTARGMGERTYSGRGPAEDAPARTASPAAAPEAASSGRYRPGMFSQRKREG